MNANEVPVKRTNCGNRQRKHGLQRLLFGKLDPALAVGKLIDRDFDLLGWRESYEDVLRQAREQGAV